MATLIWVIIVWTKSLQYWRQKIEAFINLLNFFIVRQRLLQSTVSDRFNCFSLVLVVDILFFGGAERQFYVRSSYLQRNMLMQIVKQNIFDLLEQI